MLVSQRFYEVFYLLLIESFLKRELDNVLPIGARKRTSALIWDKKYTGDFYRERFSCKKKGDKFVSTAFFQGNVTSDPRQFYRKLGEFSSKSEIIIDDLAFFKALTYLREDFTYELLYQKPIKLEAELKNLYSRFYELHKKEIEEEPLRFYNKSKTTGSVTVGLKKSNMMENEDFANVRSVVNKFYDDISIKALSEAWEALSESFKNRSVWKGHFERFAEGYNNTRGIRRIVVEDIKQSSKHFIDCVVSYEDEIEAGFSFELDSLRKMTVKNIDDFVQIVKKFKTEIEALGGKDFDKIELSKLFSPVASEYIWYQCGFQPDNIDNLFASRNTVFIERYHTCTCKKIDDKWYIDRIRHLETYMLK